MMQQPIVPLKMSEAVPQKFKQRNKNEVLLRCKVGNVELSLFKLLIHLNGILDKIFACGTKLK